VLSGEATNTNFIVFGLIRLRLEPTIYRTRADVIMYSMIRSMGKEVVTIGG